MTIKTLARTLTKKAGMSTKRQRKSKKKPCSNYQLLTNQKLVPIAMLNLRIWIWIWIWVWIWIRIWILDLNYSNPRIKLQGKWCILKSGSKFKKNESGKVNLNSNQNFEFFEFLDLRHINLIDYRLQEEENLNLKFKFESPSLWTGVCWFMGSMRNKMAVLGRWQLCRQLNRLGMASRLVTANRRRFCR